MLARRKNTQGFTLAEVLLSVAIILVLAAIAIPSVVNAQRNMHMVELDSAASQIALAAQSKMTSMKVSGTWLDELKSKVPNVDNQKAKNKPAEAQATDSLYLTREQIQKLGILTSLSIDETVFNGDYVIEFSKSTASVYGVFFSDGKASVFGGDAIDAPLQTYYVDGAGSPAKEKRLSNNPPIGHFNGTPAGATDAVALPNPAIWMDDRGMLKVEDTGLTNASLKDSLTITISKKNSSPTVSFVLQVQPISGKVATYNIGLQESNLYEMTQLPGEAKPVFKVVSRNESTAAEDQNVLQVDLGSLAVAVKGSSLSGELKAALGQFSKGEDIVVTAKVEAKQKTSVPSSAKAYMQWPGVKKALGVYVTDPDNRPDNPSEKYGTHGNIAVALKENVGGALSWVDEKEEDSSLVILGKGDQNSVDRYRNVQRFKGGNVDLEQAAEKQAVVKVEFGDYTPKTTQTAVRYQVYEIWVNETLVGHYDGSAWVWAEGVSHDFVLDPTKDVGVISAKTMLSTHGVLIDANRLASSGIPQSDAGYKVYVRTAPSLESIKTFLTNDNLSMAGSELDFGSTIGARSVVDERSTGYLFQEVFQQQIGASSSVMLWSVSKKNISDNASASDYSNDDLYTYFALTPFKAKINGGGVYDLSCAVEMRFQKEPSSRNYKKELYTAVGQTIEPSPGEDGLTVLKPQTKPISDNPTSDEFNINTETDWLYYRLISYLRDDGTFLGKSDLNNGVNPQWVPYVGIVDFDKLGEADNTNANTTFLQAVDDGKRKFLSWNTAAGGTGTSYEWNSKINESNVAHYKSNLYAKYKEPQAPAAGLMYIETYADGKHGCYGYTLPENKLSVDTLRDDGSFVVSWGYYAVVAEGHPKEELSILFEDGTPIDRSDEKKMRIELPSGVVLDAYELKPSDHMNERIYPGVTVFLTKSPYYNPADVVKAQYFCNFNFAAAVGVDNTESSKWGSVRSPFKVRCADQIIGYLKASSYVNNIYKYSSFEQTTNIDAAGLSGPSNLSEVFLASYNGGDYEIANYNPVVPNASDPTRHKGLFPVVSGSQTAGTGVLENIRLTDVSSSDQVLDLSGPGGLGILVGEIAGAGTVRNCSVSGKSDGTTNIKYIPGNRSSVYIGGIAGSVSWHAIIENCSVKNLTFSTEEKDFDTFFGGLVGSYTSDGKMVIPDDKPLLVSNVSFKVPSKGRAAAGVLLGYGSESVVPGNGQYVFENVYLFTGSSRSNVTKPIGAK